MTYEYDGNSALSNVSKSDGIISISLSDSWTGQKILGSIGNPYKATAPPDEFQVGFIRLVNTKSNQNQ